MERCSRPFEWCICTHTHIGSYEHTSRGMRSSRCVAVLVSNVLMAHSFSDMQECLYINTHTYALKSTKQRNHHYSCTHTCTYIHIHTHTHTYAPRSTKQQNHRSSFEYMHTHTHKHPHIRTHRGPRSRKPIKARGTVRRKCHLDEAGVGCRTLSHWIRARQLSKLLLLRAVNVRALKHTHRISRGLRAELGEAKHDAIGESRGNQPFAVGTVGVAGSARAVIECADCTCEHPACRPAACAL